MSFDNLIIGRHALVEVLTGFGFGAEHAFVVVVEALCRVIVEDGGTMLGRWDFVHFLFTTPVYTS